MTWRILRKEQLSAAFSRVAQEEIGRVRENLLAPAKGRDHAVHEARRSFKRLRALLRLARPSLGDDFDTENRRFRDLGRMLAPARDGRIILETFDECAKRHGKKLSSDEISRFRTELDAEVGAQVDEAALDRDIEAVMVGLQGVEQRLGELTWPDSVEAVCAGMRKTQARLRKSHGAAEVDGVADRLHEWRKRLKDRTAQLELFRPAFNDELKQLQKHAKRLAEMLGDERDLAVLLERLRSTDMAGSGHAAGVAFVGRIEQRRAKLSRDVFARDETHSARSPKAFAQELCERLQADRAAGR